MVNMAPVQPVPPETYYLSKGVLVPNNRLPVLVYRDVLPRPVAREAARELCEMNHWEMRVSLASTHLRTVQVT